MISQSTPADATRRVALDGTDDGGPARMGVPVQLLVEVPERP